jgi:hypothetical protein
VELRGLVHLHLATRVSPAYYTATADPTARERLERAVVAAVILSASIVLTATAPADGDFWWSDSPRHALNGAFIKEISSRRCRGTTPKPGQSIITFNTHR